MQERRMLLIGGVGLVRGNLQHAGSLMVDICDELEPLLQAVGFTVHAPFKTVSLVLKFGLKRDLSPVLDRIDKQHAELPVHVELEMRMLKRLSRDELKQEFTLATLSALIDVAERFSLPSQHLAELLKFIERRRPESADERGST